MVNIITFLTEARAPGLGDLRMKRTEAPRHGGKLKKTNLGVAQALFDLFKGDNQINLLY